MSSPAAHPGCMYESLPADRKSTVCPSALAAPLSWTEVLEIYSRIGVRWIEGFTEPTVCL